MAWELENDHQGVLNLKWLRENCYSEPARKIQSEMRRTQPHLGQVLSSHDNNQTKKLRTGEKLLIYYEEMYKTYKKSERYTNYQVILSQ